MWVIEFTIGYDKQNDSREESESDNNNRGKSGPLPFNDHLTIIKWIGYGFPNENGAGTDC
ncbi:hypothetical protein T08_11126 [Trichinella sp. T8]|nr:hypothetical protein T08_11126 [Trichinella sp. T8]